MAEVVVGAVASAALGGIGVTGGFAVSAILTRFATALVLGGVARALSPKPKRPSTVPFKQVSQNTFVVRQPDLTRKHVYGHTRIGTGFAHVESTGNNEYLHMVIVLCDGPIESIDEVWFNDYVIPPDWLDSEGNVTQGRYAGYARIRKHLGDFGQVADPYLVAELPGWSSTDRGQGVAYLYVRLKYNADLFPTGQPNISAVVKGRKIYDPRRGDERFTPNINLFGYDFINKAEFGFESNDDDVDTVNIATEASVCDEIVDTAAVDMTLSSVDTSTDIITLSGVRLQFMLGDRVEIVTAGSAPGGLATSTSYYVIPYQIKDTPRIQLASSLDNAIDGTAIDITSSGSGTITVRKTGEPRYYGAGVVDTDDELGDTLENILQSMAGRAVNAGGSWKLKAGRWVEPTVTLTTSDFLGEIRQRTKIPMSERFNVIQGLYISPLNDFQPADYPVLRNTSYIEADNNLESSQDLPLVFTDRPTTAQRITKIELLKSRQEIVFNVPATMKAFQMQAGDNIDIDLDRYGWTDKPFELTNIAFSVGDDMQLITNISVRETAEALFDWTTSEDADYDPAPNTTLPSPFDVEVPTGFAFSSRAVDTVDGDTVYNLAAMWNQHDNVFVREGGLFEIQFKLSSETAYRPSFFVDGSVTTTDIVTSSPNVSYDLRIRARNNLGVKSAWVTLTGAIVGTSGGVSVTEDWGEFNESPPASYEDWGNWTDDPFAESPDNVEDYGAFT